VGEYVSTPLTLSHRALPMAIERPNEQDIVTRDKWAGRWVA